MSHGTEKYYDKNVRKVVKRKGMNSAKYSVTKMDIKTEMRTED